MDRIAIRSNHRVNSRLELQTLMDQYRCENVQALADRLGKDQILRLIYREEADYDTLESDYLNFLSRQESTRFEWGYLTAPEFALCVGEHITFCHLDESTDIFPWRYMDRGIYIADSWWYEREEILKDAASLTLTEFLMKYW